MADLMDVYAIYECMHEIGGVLRGAMEIQSLVDEDCDRTLKTSDISDVI